MSDRNVASGPGGVGPLMLVLQYCCETSRDGRTEGRLELDRTCFRRGAIGELSSAQLSSDKAHPTTRPPSSTFIVRHCDRASAQLTQHHTHIPPAPTLRFAYDERDAVPNAAELLPSDRASLVAPTGALPRPGTRPLDECERLPHGSHSLSSSALRLAPHARELMCVALLQTDVLSRLLVALKERIPVQLQKEMQLSANSKAKQKNKIEVYRGSQSSPLPSCARSSVR